MAFDAFRQPQGARRTEPEPIENLLRVTAPHEWAIVTGLILALLPLAAWGVFGRVEVSLMVEGALVQPGERSPVVSAVSGRIMEVLVQPGDVLADRARIAVIEPAGLDTRVRVAQATEDLLAELLDRSGGPDGSALRVALAEVRAERLALDALDTAGSAIVSARSGVVTALLVAAGDFVEAGATAAWLRHGADGEVAAVAFLTARRARTVRPGMPARVLIEPAGGGAPRALPGEVATVSGSVTFPGWLDAAALAASWTPAAARGHLVTFSLTGQEDLRGGDLRSCRVEIIQQRVPPLALLAPARSR